MQKYVTALSYAMVPGLQQMRQEQMMDVANARAELAMLGVGLPDRGGQNLNVERADPDTTNPVSQESTQNYDARRNELMSIVQNGGRTLPPPPRNRNDPIIPFWDGPKVRIYFPDEGSSALARRDWTQLARNPDDDIVPPCVEFSSVGGVMDDDCSKDTIILFFCPRATDAEAVEKTLNMMEQELADRLLLTVFVNPVLVDMTVTGFGMAGRMLRERLIDPLMPTYYLRTLSWGALTRVWPGQFTVWQEDGNMEGGYRMIKCMERLPSNPEVEDIYDYENGIANDPEASKGFGLLNAIADFANGMMRL